MRDYYLPVVLFISIFADQWVSAFISSLSFDITENKAARSISKISYEIA